MWERAIDTLRGTALTPAQAGIEDLFEDSAFCEYLDTEIFLCACCGWWCDISQERSDEYDLDELTCEDCV